MEQGNAKYHTESERKIGMTLWKHAVAQDLEKVTVMEICQEAGVSRSTFYRHFSNPKQALGKVISDYQAERMHSKGDAAKIFPDLSAVCCPLRIRRMRSADIWKCCGIQ